MPSSGEKRWVGDGVWLKGMSRPLTLTGLIGKDSQDPADRRTAVDSPQDFSKSQEGGRGGEVLGGEQRGEEKKSGEGGQ